MYEYVSKYIDLKRNGKAYWGRCPLHVDRVPSFTVSKDVNKWYCFSCGRGGGVIQFFVRYEKLSYEQAIEKAASLAEVDLSKMCCSQTVLLNKQLKRYYEDKKITEQHIILPESTLDKYQKEPVAEWLDEGIRQEELDLFQIRIDKYSNRIIYPVRDENGRLINIKGRTRLKDFGTLNVQKYMNYYSVGTMDYFQSAEKSIPYIKEEREVKIFESVKSVMKLYGHGERNVISAEKNTLTMEQIEWLIKTKVNVVLCYDSDVMYFQKPAIKRNIDLLKRFTNVYIIRDKKNLLGGKDAKNAPIDCGYDIWRELYKNRERVK